MTYEQTWRAVKKIPAGKVTTYGEIARFLNIKDERIVGWALHANKDAAIPCHRVVKADGSLAENYAFGGWREQKRKLLKEGVKFISSTKADLSASFFYFNPETEIPTIRDR
ncbi:MAG TPA: MGMT family protein [Candidatus Bathyarchaeia archaeon]|nr:MGMT family protein [Candidatus Bathyarchaeia archaeon]